MKKWFWNANGGRKVTSANKFQGTLAELLASKGLGDRSESLQLLLLLLHRFLCLAIAPHDYLSLFLCALNWKMMKEPLNPVARVYLLNSGLGQASLLLGCVGPLFDSHISLGKFFVHFAFFFCTFIFVRHHKRNKNIILFSSFLSSFQSHFFFTFLYYRFIF